MSGELRGEIERHLVRPLRPHGFKVFKFSNGAAMGSFYVEVGRGGLRIGVTNDRGQIYARARTRRLGSWESPRSLEDVVSAAALAESRRLREIEQRNLAERDKRELRGQVRRLYLEESLAAVVAWAVDHLRR